MATIYRRESSPYWYCSFYVTNPEGERKQIRKPTKERAKKEAETKARILEEQYKAEHGMGDEKSREIMAKVREAADLALVGDLNADKAQSIITQILELSTGETLQVYTVREWCLYWLENRSATTKESTLKTYRGVINKFLLHLGERSDIKLQNLSSRDVTNFRDSIKAAGRTGKTANQNIKAIRSCLESAKREGVILRNVAENTESLPVTDSIERRPFTVEQVASIIKAAPSADWKGVSLVGVYTGIRLNDAASLIWKDIDLHEGTITLVPQKTDRHRTKLTIPLHPELAEFFLSHPSSENETDSVFPSLANKSTGGRSGLSDCFAGIMEKAKIKRTALRSIGKGAARTMYDLSFHSFRHTANSLMAKAGVSQELRRKITGHTTDRMNDIYTHTEIDTLRKAVGLISIEKS